MRRFSILLLALLTALFSFGQAKYIFYFIGDGMGPNVVLLTEMYQAQCKGRIGVEPLRMTQFPHYGSASSFSFSNSITDSSAAGTCLASGVKTINGRLGLDPNGKHFPTVAELLQKRGYKIGIMTSVSIDHATPGAFYARVEGRNDFYQIGRQLAESEFDFFAGSSFYEPVNKKNPSDINLYDYCESKGYAFAHSSKDALTMKANGKEHVILIQQSEGMDRTKPCEGHIPYAIDHVAGALTLPEITSTAIDFLYEEGQPFFMMVEGGQIDWANHANDAATAIGEVQEFDKAIQAAFGFYEKHPDETLIIVTADHETGGLALGNNHYTLTLDLLQNQKGSAPAISERFQALCKQHGKKLTFDQVKLFLSAELGLYDKVQITAEEDAQLRDLFTKMKKHKATDAKSLYASVNAVCNAAIALLNKHAEIGWTTHSHSAAAVPIFAIGVGAERFSGFIDNSEIAPMIMDIAQ